MLKSWSIQNFKPILDSGELELAPVTVLAGRNSSGKSSLIQSILMIAQMLSSRVLDRPLLPHGSFAHLGTFEDILNKYSDQISLIVGFQLEVGAEVGIKSVRVTSEFISSKSNETRKSAIESSKVNIEKVFIEVISYISGYYGNRPSNAPTVGGELFKFHFSIRKMIDRELEDFLSGVASEFLRHVPYSSKEINYLGVFQSDNQGTESNVPDPSLVAFSHFLPSRLTTKFKVEERRRRMQLEDAVARLLGLSGEEGSIRERPSLFDYRVSMPDDLKEEILEICKDENIPYVFSGESFEDFHRFWTGMRVNDRKILSLRPKFYNTILRYLLENNPRSEMLESKGSEALETLLNNVYVENLEEAVKQITKFFTSKIRYLGPLRADPEIAQGFPPSSEADDVGIKGQYAATVYDANQNAKMHWYNPITQKIEESELKTALNTWARYLDVAHQVQIQVAGQSGVSWQIVHRDGHEPLPLTAVGVGLSQILPILVMGLLTPSDTLLLVEQPELHLHPSVQARLGDFFMGLARCNKQCVIETHSENLVSQLRYHIVQANGQEKSDCLIYFVDQDERGAAKFEPIEISPQGNILNWPEGFFDETVLQEGRITTASLRKRATKADND